MGTGADRSFEALLRDLRLANALTQEALAERAGVSDRSIRALERGGTRPQRDTARRLARALGLEGAELAVFLAAAAPAPRHRTPARAGAAPSSTFPAPPTPLIGRDGEVAAIMALIRQGDHRAVTLTGPGGVGKTRLALQVAELLREQFPDGVVFIPLASLADPELVLPTIAAACGVMAGSGQALRRALDATLRDRHLLLLLDNFEHVVAAVPAVADLAATHAGLRLLVTSRAALRMRGEQVYLVPPLPLPYPGHLPPLEVLDRIASVRLFVERAQAIMPDFVLTPANAREVAEICVHLDGLPLAIELSAARVDLLSPAALLRRLRRNQEAHPLRLLSWGARDAPERQRTMRAAIGWSHDLLAAEEQVVFRRLAVFRGGWDLEAAATVCMTDLSLDAFSAMSALADQHLLVTQDADGEPRFTMLETIREYALERLDREIDNIRAALAWLREHGDIEEVLRLAAALYWFWYLRGYRSEGRAWLNGALALAPVTKRSATRAAALAAAGGLGMLVDDDPTAGSQLEESVGIWRQLDDRRGLPLALTNLGVVLGSKGDGTAARALTDEALAVAQAAGDQVFVAISVHGLGWGAISDGDHATARDRFAESLRIFRELGTPVGLALVLNSLGDLERMLGDDAKATAHYEESLAMATTVGYKAQQATCCHNLAHVVRRQRDGPRARALFGEGLALFRDIGDTRAVAECLAGLAGVDIESQPERSARMLGAAVAVVETVGGRLFPWHQADLESSVATARDRLGNEAFTAAWEEGRSMTLGEAIAYAVRDDR